MKTTDMYTTKVGTDGKRRLYVQTWEIKVIKTRQGKKIDMVEALKCTTDLHDKLHKAMLEHWDDNNLPEWAKEEK